MELIITEVCIKCKYSNTILDYINTSQCFGQRLDSTFRGDIYAIVKGNRKLPRWHQTGVLEVLTGVTQLKHLFKHTSCDFSY